MHPTPEPAGAVAAPAYDLAAARAALPALRDVTYLNTGTEGIMAAPVLREHLRAVAWHETHGHYGQAAVLGLLEASRARLARLLDVAPDELALTTNATDGVNLVAFGREWRPGDEALLSDQEHPAITYPFFSLQRAGRLRVRLFAVSPDPDATAANFRDALTDRTRLAAFSQVSCETGIRLPARALCALAAGRGVATLLDGAQSVGQFPVRPREIGPDYLTGNGHKWLGGPKGTGFLYVAARRLPDLLPPYVGAGSLTSAALAARRYDDPATIQLDFEPSARRYEYGTRNLGRFAALHTAIEYLERLGWDAIWRHQAALAAALKERLAALPGATLHTPRDPDRSTGLVTVSFAAPDGAPVDGVALSRRLWAEGVIQRPVLHLGAIRLSCAYFTAPQDLDRLLAVLKERLAGDER
jgi:L-cysteine/cystine lyase